LEQAVMARSGQQQNRPKSDHTVLNDAHITFPCEQQFSPPTGRMRIDKQRDDGPHGKGIEKQPVKPILIL
jgi:hypothetical protein